MFWVVCAGEEYVEEAIAKEGFKAELAAIDYVVGSDFDWFGCKTHRAARADAG